MISLFVCTYLIKIRYNKSPPIPSLFPLVSPNITRPTPQRTRKSTSDPFFLSQSHNRAHIRPHCKYNSSAYPKSSQRLSLRSQVHSFHRLLPCYFLVPVFSMTSMYKCVFRSRATFTPCQLFFVHGIRPVSDIRLNKIIVPSHGLVHRNPSKEPC